MEIEELKYRSLADNYGNRYGSIPPTTDEIVRKINEIIEILNAQPNSEA